MKLSSGSAAAAAITLAVLTPLAAAAQDGWSWEVMPYLWGAAMTLDAEVNDEPAFGGEASFSDLVDKLDFAGQVHFEGRAGKGGFLIDATFMSLSDRNAVAPEGPGIGPGGGPELDLGSSTDLTLLDLAGTFRPKGPQHGLDVIAGARFIEVDSTVDFTLATTPRRMPPSTRLGIDESYTDAFIGVRYGAPIGESWRVVARGDIGGGDTDGHWNASLLFGWSFGQDDRYSLLFGWRHFELEVEADDRGVQVENEITMDGPLVGFRFGF